MEEAKLTPTEIEGKVLLISFIETERDSNVPATTLDAMEWSGLLNISHSFSFRPICNTSKQHMSK